MGHIFVLALWAQTVLPGMSPEEPPPKNQAPAAQAVKEDSNSEAKKVRILAWAPWNYALPETGTLAAAPQQLVIHSAEDLVAAMGLNEKGDNIQQEVTATLAKALQVKTIDWNEQMLVVVTGGVQRSSGFSVDIDRLEARGKDLLVHWNLRSPSPGQAVTRKLTHPGEVILVERVEGKVKFEPAATR